MFRAVKMMQVQTIVLLQDEHAVLRGLGELGAAHLARIQSGTDTTPLSLMDYTRELAQYDHIRARVQELRQSLDIIPSAEKLSHNVQTDLGRAESNLLAMEKEAGALLEHRRRLEHRRKELIADCEQITCYQGLEIPLDGPDGFSFLHFVTGNLPEQNFEGFKGDIGDNVALVPLARQKGHQSIFAITTRQGQPALERALQQAGFQRETLPQIEGATVDGHLQENLREQEKISAELDRINSRIRYLAESFKFPLDEIEEFAYVESRILDAGQKFQYSGTTVLIAGWVPASDVGLLEERINQITCGRYVLKASPPDALMEEQVPVLLRHSILLRPFEILVSTYGLPDYRELEPTLFVALSYIIMFGMMFGDAGHGLVLAFFGFFALFKGRPGKQKDMGVLILLGGMSSIIFGIVYGSYFGIEALKRYAIWHDPLEGDPAHLMYCAMGIGFAMISLGLILNVINRFKRRDVIGGILDKFGLVGLLFYWGTLILLIKGPAIQSRGLMGLSIILFLAVPIVGWSLKEPLEEILNHSVAKHGEEGNGLAGAFIESCVGAFEAILSYLANTISFVRLAAYAMSHAALLFAAFMLAEEVRSFSVGGGIFSILIIIIGNIIAIVLEGVIASVQALRLEYYEFFGKFFAGSGRPFEPFCLASDKRNRAL